MSREMKPVAWLGTSLDDLRVLPQATRREAGGELMRLQHGLMPTDWKPMPSVGPGVHEIRIHVGVEVRSFCIANFTEAIYVLHSFVKKTRKTSPGDPAVARQRLADLVHHRKGLWGSA